MSIFTRFLKFYWSARTKRAVSDMFVQQFCEEVLEDDRYYYCFSGIEMVRNRLQQDSTVLEVNDLGAGSRKMHSNRRTVQDILKNSVSPMAKSQRLFRIVNLFQPKTKIEVGTSLGISTMYQYFPNTKGLFYTLEGCPNILEVAQRNFKACGAKNIQTVLGNFDQTLSETLTKIKKLDYALLDGNHRGEATIRYFEQCLPYVHERTVLVFDDIYWSEDMLEAWKQIIAHERVTLALDLFQLGVVFFDSSYTKECIPLIESKYKPFSGWL